MTLEQWMKEARRAAKHLWCYEGLVDDAEMDFTARYERGDDPYDAVKEVGEKYDLIDFKAGW
jgi:hypothetical protein